MARQQKISARRLKAQGRHAAAGHHRRSRPDRFKGSLESRRAADRRRGLSLQPPPAAGRREIVTAKIERSDQYDLHGSVAGF